jgi:alkylation response protein AidB-like acyl-CoA dehydrogenase
MHKGDGMDQRVGAFAIDRVSPVRSLVEQWEREPWDREDFPAARLDALRATAAWTAFADMATADDALSLLDVLRLIGRVDLSLGRLFEGHVNALQLVATYGSDAQRRDTARVAEAGALFGVWATEPAPGLMLTRIGPDEWRLEGSKSFATGAGHVDRAVVTALGDDGARQLVAVDLTLDKHRAATAGWRVRGMQGTLSGLFDFSGIVVRRDSLIGAPDDYQTEPRFSAGAWRFAAVQLGAVEALARHLRDHLVATPKGADPIQRARFAVCIAGARSAGEWVRRAARLAEAQSDDAVAFVLMTRGIVEEAGLAVMEAAARTVGTAAFFTGNPIDRITRDLGLYLRQPVPDQARDRAAAAWLESDRWGEDRWW